MKIYESSVKNPITTVLVFIAVMIFGAYSLKYLPIDLYPEIDPPVISVFTFYQGANASDIETNVSRLLEDNLNTVNNLKEISSVSKDNLSLITLEFEWGANLDEATNDIRDALSRVERSLPDGSEKPMIFKFNTSMIPILMLSATAEESYAALDKILDEKIVNPLNRIDGVGAVSVSGGPVREIQVNVDPQKIEAYGLSVEQIGGVIAQENFNLPAGNIDLGTETYPLRIEGEFKESEKLKTLIIGNYQGKTVFLSDVATVNDTLQKMSLEERSNGRVGARIIIQKQSGANSVQIAKEVMAMLPKLQKDLPPDIQIETIFDTSEFIENSINSLTDTVLYAGIFVMLVVLFFLGRWRATFIIILTIPVSLIVAFIYLYATGNTINIISLSSLSIAIGMVVDDAIVVLENITTHIEKGSSPREAAIYGTNEVGLAVVATTLTVVAVFFPLTLVGGLSGIMFKQLGWIVTLVVVVSTIAALTLTPMLSSQMLRLNPPRKKGLSKSIFDKIEGALTWLDNGYESILTWSVRHKTVVVVSALTVFIASLFLIPLVGTEFIPASDNSRVSATIELPVGVRVEYSQQVARSIEQNLKANYPEVELASVSAGSADDRNIFSAMGSNGTHIINLMLKLTDPKERTRDMEEVGDALRKDFDAMPEVVKYTVTPGGNNGMGGGSQVEIIISGYDLEASGKVAEELAARIKNVPGTRDIDISREDFKPEYQVEFNRDKLAQFGINTTTASSFIRNRINGLVASKYREDGDEYDIVVRYDESFRSTIEDIENITIYNSQGKGVKVKELGKVVERFSPPSIERQNRQRVVKVTTALYKASLGDVVKGIEAEIAQISIPDGLSIDIGGTAQDQQESFADLGTLFLLIVILVYIVMASQFESFRSPFIIMLSLPFAFTGVFLSLYIAGQTLNLISMIGAIMLVGIVVKNGIVLVDFTNLLRDRGLSVTQAVIAAGKSRLRPVLMTTLTTILGMVPLALGTGEGSEIWQPMGIAIIGGLTFSTLLTLVVVPVVYTLFGAARMKRERKRMLQLTSDL
ncbi:MAG: efflux RND transporter permease subunit [Bacteroidales bacterium]|nr:efflux RND transporter permease subunit [Bacteroidales bacterium]MBN2750763.1 efflux RND transporter permease subunit [Bacteroidales bacterium]